MRRIMILAENEIVGRRYARKHHLNRRDVVPLYDIGRASEHTYDDYVIVGNVRLDEAQWAALTPTLLTAGKDVLDRFFYESQGKLPPPIELERVSVVKF